MRLRRSPRSSPSACITTNRINALNTQVNDLRSQLYDVQNSLSNQIAGISSNVSDILERESSLLSQFSYEVTKVDLKKQECTLAFSLLPEDDRRKYGCLSPCD